MGRRCRARARQRRAERGSHSSCTVQTIIHGQATAVERHSALRPSRYRQVVPGQGSGNRGRLQ
eukprot:35057-Eustigmatos_ZCMA.PRE.1